MIAGEAVLVEDDGETVLRPGDVCAWPAGVRDGHHVQNRVERRLRVRGGRRGRRGDDRGEYPDIDMVFGPEGYARKDGTPYPTKRIH